MILPGAMNAGPRKLRAFIALKTPPFWDEKLQELQHRHKSSFGSSAFRWVKAEQMHITLRFFGWIATPQVEELITILPAICLAHPPFTLCCESLGAFPNLRQPRVFWAGLKGDLVEAAALQNEISSATSGFGEPPEDRPFKPHLTLARLKNPERSLVADLEEAISRGFQIDEPWNVTDLLLMQSHLSPQGSTYETIRSFKLGG